MCASAFGAGHSFELRHERHPQKEPPYCFVLAQAAGELPQTAQKTAQTAGAQTKTVLTDTQCTFTVTVDSPPAFVSAQMPEWPNGVHFISSRLLAKDIGAKNIIMEGDGTEENGPYSGGASGGSVYGGGADGALGTEISVALAITKEGEYTLPAVTLTIMGEERPLYFPPLYAAQNPDTAIPYLTLVIEDVSNKKKVSIHSSAQNIAASNVSPIAPPANASSSALSPVLAIPVGGKVRLKIIPRYAVIDNLHWNVGEDTIFQKEDTPQKTFLWQPLKAGKAFLPKITCDATAINGKPITLLTPVAAILVIPSQQKVEASKAEGGAQGMTLFSSAFDKASYDGAYSAATDKSSSRIAATREQCQTIAHIRCRERNAFFPWQIRKERIAYERGLGIAGENEMSRLPLTVCLAILFIAIAAFAVCLKRRLDGFVLFALGAATAIMASLAFLCAIVLSSEHGVFAGSVIHSIPDEGAAATPLATGSIVRILDKGMLYLYIKSGALEGWTQAENVIVIR